MSATPHPTDHADFWESRYLNQETGWDLGTVSPPLKALIDQFQPSHAQKNVLIPGAGNGHEAAYMLQTGFRHITVLDIAASPLKNLQDVLDPGDLHRVHLVQENFFQYHGSYDLILEQTFFCALHPDHRSAYAKHMSKLLTPDGILAGVLFNREFPHNPPFGGRVEDYEALFAPHFQFLRWEACPCSHPARAGSEWWMILQRK